MFRYETYISPRIQGAAFLTLVPILRALNLIGGWLPWLDGMALDRPASAIVPFSVIALAAATSMTGWAFLLTGASDCGRRVFLPLVVLFFWTLTLLVWPLPERNIIIPIMAGCLLVLGAIHAATARRGIWQDRPELEFVIWLTIATVPAIVTYLIGNTYDGKGPEALVRGMEGALMLPAVLALPLWTLGGLEAVELALNVGRGAARGLTGRLGDRHLLVLGWMAPCLACAIAAAVTVTGLDPVGLVPTRTLALDTVPAVAVGLVWYGAPVGFLVWALVRALRHRWDLSAASGGVVLAIAWPIFFAAFAMAVENKQDLVELAATAPGVVPPYTIAVVLLAHNVATFGARHANREGRIMVRQGRVLMHFGVLLVMVACAMFFSAHGLLAFGEIVRRFEPVLAAGLLLGIGIMGPIYLAWRNVRRPDRLLELDTERHALEHESAQPLRG